MWSSFAASCSRRYRASAAARAAACRASASSSACACSRSRAAAPPSTTPAGPAAGETATGPVATASSGGAGAFNRKPAASSASTGISHPRSSSWTAPGRPPAAGSWNGSPRTPTRPHVGSEEGGSWSCPYPPRTPPRPTARPTHLHDQGVRDSPVPVSAAVFKTCPRRPKAFPSGERPGQEARDSLNRARPPAKFSAVARLTPHPCTVRTAASTDRHPTPTQGDLHVHDHAPRPATPARHRPARSGRTRLPRSGATPTSRPLSRWPPPSAPCSSPPSSASPLCRTDPVPAAPSAIRAVGGLSCSTGAMASSAIRNSSSKRCTVNRPPVGRRYGPWRERSASRRDHLGCDARLAVASSADTRGHLHRAWR